MRGDLHAGLPAPLARNANGVQSRFSRPVTIGVWKEDRIQIRFNELVDSRLFGCCLCSKRFSACRSGGRRVRVGKKKPLILAWDQGLCPSFRGIAANLFQAATSAIPLAITLAPLA